LAGVSFSDKNCDLEVHVQNYKTRIDMRFHSALEEKYNFVIDFAILRVLHDDEIASIYEN